MRVVQTLIIIFGFFQTAIFGSKEFEIKFLKQYANQQIEANVVSAFLCWEKQDLRKLILALSEENSYAVTRNPEDIIKNLNIPFKEQNLIILDLSCQNSEEILHKANQQNLFGIKFRWIIFIDGAIFEKIPEIFRAINILLDSRVILAQKTSSGSNSELDLFYIYKTGPKNQELIFSKITTFQSKSPKLNFDLRPVAYTRKNLRQEKLRASLIFTYNDTLDHLTDFRYGNMDTQTKVGYQITNTLLEFLNASLEIVWERSWGEYVGNNTFTGLLGRLHRKEIELAGSPLFCISQRLAFYDCVSMAMPAKGFFLFKQPPLSYVANIFTLPFETNLWLTDIAFLIVCALFLYFIIRWEWNSLEERNHEVENDMITKSFWEAVMFTVGAVCQQGYPTEPKSGSGKIIILTLFFTLLFMFTAFSANTVVLFQSSATNIKTLEDLYDSKMPLAVHDTLYYKFWFPRHFDPIRRKIYTDRIAPKGDKPRFLKIEEGIKKVRYEYFGFHTDEVTAYKVISDTFEEHEKCGLQRIPYLYVTLSNPWNTTPKNSSYREIFYIGYKLIQERGILQRTITKLYTAKPECSSRGSTFRSAGILDLYSVYMLFFIGISGSISLLLLELFSKYIIKPYIKRYYMAKKIKMLQQDSLNIKPRR